VGRGGATEAGGIEQLADEGSVAGVAHPRRGPSSEAQAWVAVDHRMADWAQSEAARGQDRNCSVVVPSDRSRSPSTTMLRRALPFPSQCLRQATSPAKAALAGLPLLQKRYKHGRDFPRNVPPPPPPPGPKLASNAAMTLYHSPAPSAPTYKSTPLSFLPATAPFDATHLSSMVPLRTQLPPPLQNKRPRLKRAHLREEDIAKIRELRYHADPAKRKSRRELASMFGCGSIFVGMVAPLTNDALRERTEAREKQVQQWGERKRFLREARSQRKHEWLKGDE